MKLRDLKKLIAEELKSLKNERANVMKHTCRECSTDSDCGTGEHCSSYHYPGHNCCMSGHGMAQTGNKGMGMQRPTMGRPTQRPMRRQRPAAMRARRNAMRNRRMPGRR
jgi:hypothetical protein